jgi:hypothetical protein
MYVALRNIIPMAVAGDSASSMAMSELEPRYYGGGGGGGGGGEYGGGGAVPEQQPRSVGGDDEVRERQEARAMGAGGLIEGLGEERSQGRRSDGERRRKKDGHRVRYEAQDQAAGGYGDRRSSVHDDMSVLTATDLQNAANLPPTPPPRPASRGAPDTAIPPEFSPADDEEHERRAKKEKKEKKRKKERERREEQELSLPAAGGGVEVDSEVGSSVASSTRTGRRVPNLRVDTNP